MHVRSDGLRSMIGSIDIVEFGGWFPFENVCMNPDQFGLGFSFFEKIPAAVQTLSALGDGKMYGNNNSIRLVSVKQSEICCVQEMCIEQLVPYFQVLQLRQL